MQDEKREFERPKIKKLTKWAKEPQVTALKEDLAAAKPSHDVHAGRIKRWNSMREVTGEYKPKKIKNRSSVQPKLIRRQAEWRYSALSEPFLSSDRMFTVSGRTWEDVKAAKQNQLVLNWQFDTKIDKVKFIDDFVHTAVDEGTVIVRLGWFRDTVKEKVRVPVFTYFEIQTQAEAQQLQAALQLKEADPHGYEDQVPEELRAAVDYLIETGTPTVAEITGHEERVEERVVENRPTLDILDYDNVFIDPSCQGDIDKAKFAVISFETSYSELKKDGRYSNLEAVNWEGASILATPDHATRTPQDFNFSDKARKRIVAYEYWGYYDVNGDGVLVPIVATWVGDVLVRLEENPFPDKKIPLVVVPYMPIKRALEGEPDAEILEDNQAILGATMRGMIDLMGRSANSQQGFAKGFLDVTNRRRFENGQDYEFNPGNGDPRLSIYQHSYPEIPNSALTMLQLQNQDAEALTGVKSFSGGISGEAYGEVAAGIKGMLDAASKREMSILRRLTGGMMKIGQKLMAMNALFLSEEEVVRVTNDEFVTVKREDLVGKFDMLCDISTPEVDQARAQDLGFMLQTMGPDMDPAMSRMILAEIADLKRMPALAKQIREYQPQPDPLAVEQKRLEIEKLKLELEELRSKIALNRAKAGEHAAKTDKADLDFLEQETGTKHERDLQRTAVQAKSQGDTKILDALLKPTKEGEQRPDFAAALGFRKMAENI